MFISSGTRLDTKLIKILINYRQRWAKGVLCPYWLAAEQDEDNKIFFENGYVESSVFWDL